MRISPCKGCRKGRELKDKNHPDCVNCTERVEYSHSHGSFFDCVKLKIPKPVEVKNMDNQEIKGAQVDNVDKPGYQICKDENCKHAGKLQPIGNFGLHGISKEPLGYCNECMTRKRSGKRKKKHIDNRQEAVSAAALILTINFAGHQELLEKIRNTAKTLMREPEAQVLYWLIWADFDKLGDLG